MVFTDFMGRGSIASTWMLCCSLLILNLGNQLLASEGASPPTLVCDGQVNVSLGDDCDVGVIITPDMILEGTIDPSYTYSVSISGPGLAAGGDVITDVGNYEVTITSSDGNRCWGNIKAEDKFGPNVIDCDCPQDNPCTLQFMCNDLIEPTDAPDATDCSEFTVSHSDNFLGSDCASVSTLIRTWTYRDVHNNITLCQQYFTTTPFDVTTEVVCPHGEDATDPKLVQIPCGLGTTPKEIYNHYYAAHVEANPFSDPPTEVELAEAYRIAVSRAYPYYVTSTDALGNPLNVVKLDGNVCSTFTSFEDIILPSCSTEPGCEQITEVVRTWKVFDWCDPTAPVMSCSQVIRSVDTEGPTFDIQKSLQASVDPWDCSANVCFPKPNHLKDNCSLFVNYEVTGSGTGSGSTFIMNPFNVEFDKDLGSWCAKDVPIGNHSFIYRAYDCCQNETTDTIQVTVQDATPPVAITKQDIVVSLIPNPSNPDVLGITKIHAESLDNGSFDGCGDVKLEIRRDTDSCDSPSNITFNNDGHVEDDSLDIDGGKFVTFCCNDLIDADGNKLDFKLIDVFLRVWDDGNGDGIYGSEGDNSSEVWSTVRLEDKSSRPTIVCPADITVDCDEDIASTFGTASAFSSCGIIPTDFREIDIDLSSCSRGKITREWFVVGQENVKCQQIIERRGDEDQEVVVTFPRDTVLSCTESLLTDVPTWISGPCDQLAYSLNTDTFYFQEGACYKILNHWRVINWCTYNPDSINSDGIYTKVQTVKVFDDSAPEITGCTTDNTFSIGAGCKSNAVMLTNSATDVGICASNRLRWTALVDLHGNGWIDMTFSSTADPSGDYYIPPSVSGEEIRITLPEDVPGSLNDHVVTWRVTDGCGNNASCNSTFKVVDNIPPTPYCVNLSTSLMIDGSIEIWACDFDRGAFDNCTAEDDIRYTFTSTPPEDDENFDSLTGCSSREFNCDDLTNPSGSLVTVNVYVWDERNNSDFCTVFITLVDNNQACDSIPDGMSPIGGEITTETGEEIEDVMVELTSSLPQYPIQKMTDNSGHFLFGQNPTDNEYQLTSTKNDDFLNGISTLDLVLIQRHVLGTEKLDSPYKLIAADINNDSKVNGIDLIELRKLILGIYTELPNNDSWRFVDKSSSMDVVYPWPFNEIRTILSLDNVRMQEDFIGVKIGDVNGSAIANARDSKPVGRSVNNINLSFEDVSYEAGETVTMQLTANEITELVGLQFTLEANGLSLTNVEGEGIQMQESNFAVLSDGLMTFSWNSEQAVAESELFTLEFTATQKGILSQNINLSSDITSAEAYAGGSLEILPITLSGRNNSEQDFALYQNTPNPFSDVTDLTFSLPLRTDASLTVSDVTGRTLWSRNGTFDAGVHTFNISSKELNANGILYYRLEAGTFTVTKKMIVLK